MSDKGRKQETTRVPTTVPQLVSAPGLVPHHATSYTIHSDASLPIHASHHLTYSMMRGPSLGMSPALAMSTLSGKGRGTPAISNDLGPPIFMPSLNLGVPKPSTTPSGMVPKPKNSITQSSMSSTLVSDILSNAPAPFQPLSAFHAMRPTQPSPYIAHPHAHSHPHPNMGMKLHTHPSLQQPHAVANAMGKPVPHSVAAPVTSSMLQKQGVVRVPSNVTKVPNQARPSPSTGLPKFSSVASVSQPVLTIPQAGKLVSTKGITSAAMMSPEGESPPIVTGHMTYVTPSLPPMAVHTVPYMSHQGLMVTHSYPTPPQPHSTLSKMLLAPSAPTQQQNIRPPKSHVAPVSTFTHSPGQPQPTSKPGSSSSHTPLPTSQLSTVQKPGSAPPTDGYSMRGISQDGSSMATPTLATSGQPSSSASYTDTRLERPPQPSAVPMQQSATAAGGIPSVTQAGCQWRDGNGTFLEGPRDRTTADVASGIIISMPGLTGKHIAAITNSGLQPVSPGYPQPGMMETGMQPITGLPPPHPLSQQPDDAATGQPPGVSQTSVPSAGLLSPAQGVGVVSSAGLTMSPNQGNSSPRPHILRKRTFDGNWKTDGPPNATTTSPSSSACSPLINKLPLGSAMKQQQGTGVMGHLATTPTGDRTPTFNSTPLSPGGEGTSNHLGGMTKAEQADLMSSPRKKPRKQNVVANDDQYASNVPNSISSETPPPSSLAESGGEEERPRPPPPTTMTTRSSRRLEEAERVEEAPKKVEFCYLSQLRRSPYPINGVYRTYHRAAHNHFKRHADIKHREEERTSAYDIASKRSNWQRATGWKLLHFESQLDEMSKVEKDILETMMRLKKSIHNLGQCASCSTNNTQLLETCEELVEGNMDRSNRILSHISDTRTGMLKVLDNEPQVTELLRKFSTNKSPNSSYSSSASQKSRS